MTILGHSRQEEALRVAARSDRLPHALLFTGPEGVGKREVATAFARELVAGDDPDEARRFDHGVCERFLLYSDLEGALPVRRGDLLGGGFREKDLLEAYAVLTDEEWIDGVASAKGEEVVDLLRRNPARFTGRKGIPLADVLERELAALDRSKKSTPRMVELARRLFAPGVSRAPYRRSIGIELINGKGDGALFRTIDTLLGVATGDAWRVILIDDAHKMTDAAENALLKTLEEPPPRTLIVLITSEPMSLLSTTLSRCARVPFDTVPGPELERFLVETQGVPEDEAALLAALADGSPGRALELRGLDFAERREFIDDLLPSVADGNLGRSLALVGRRLAAAAAASRERSRDAERQEAGLALELLALSLRDLVICSASPAARTLSGMDAARAAELARSRPPEDWAALFTRTELALSDLKANVEPRLAIEALLVESIPERVDT